MSFNRRTPEERDATPPTRSYTDALMQGDMTEAQLSELAAQVSGEIPAPGEEEADEARTAFHAYTAEEQRDPDEVHTAFHAYSPEEHFAAFGEAIEARAPSHPVDLGRARPEGRTAAAPPALDDDDDDARTLMRPSNAPRALSPSSPAHRAISPSSPAPAGGHSSAPVHDGGSLGTPSSAPMPPPRARSGGFRIRPSSAPSAPPVSPPRAHTPVPSSPRHHQPIVDIGDLLDEPLAFETASSPHVAPLHADAPPPSGPKSGPKSAEEVPISVPSLRTHQVHAIDDSYLAVLGGPNGVLRLAVTPAQLTTLPLGPQAGFLLSCIDGVSNLDEVIDISGQSRLDTLRLLYELLQQGVIAVASR